MEEAKNEKFFTDYRHMINEENKLLRKVSLEDAKPKAKEQGFNPEKLDFFLNNQGRWCFYYYDVE